MFACTVLQEIHQVFCYC